MDEPQSRASEVISLPERSSSPSPSIPATPAISSYSSPDRTFSSVSSRSASSSTSADARSTVSTSSRRHGYVRAFGGEFAESARHRDSVMSLGSIAHLQYYFARTGLLDGKTGRGKEFKKKNGENVPRVLITPNAANIDDQDFVASPSEITESPEYDLNLEDEDGEVMLPPTVSTYSIKTHHIPPPPDLISLRRDLQVALEKADSNIEAVENGIEPPPREPIRTSLSPGDIPETMDDNSAREPPIPSNKEEAQGMSILDDVTLAIRAAKIYYTAHPHPERLASIKSDSEIRKDLFHVLDALKRWAARHFACGLRPEERDVIQGWIAGVRTMLVREKALEDLEAQERENWDWARGDWKGRERAREESFLRSLMPGGHTLPEWTPIADDATVETLPTEFLEHFRDGRILVQLHNIAVKKSKRPFGEIKAFHEDIAKPYRQADNLRFWIKAAELRWELRFKVDVMGVVQGTSEAAWIQFDTALLAWCKTVREELVRDWQAANPGRPPIRLSSPADSPNEHGPLRRLKSKSSLWSIGSSNPDEEPIPEPSSAEKNAGKQSIFRRLSPALAARVKLLDGGSKVTSAPRNPGAVGRIPEEQLKELDSQHKDLSIKVERRGQAWNGVALTSPASTTSPELLKRSASNNLELPSQNLLQEFEKALEEGSDNTDAVVDGPEPPVLADAPSVTAPDTETNISSTSMSVVEPAPAQLRADPDPSPPVPAQDDQDTRTDFEKYVDDTKRSEEQAESAPEPPPKDEEPPSSPTYSLSSSSNPQSYFNPRGLQRAESIYSFSRASFSNQLSQLTSIPLPQPGALETSIRNIATALAAVRALNGAAEQIHIWIRKASDVLSGLDSEDDVEWAAAGGREGLDGVDKAITRFESLVNVYVKAIENVQLRDDIANVDSESLKTIVRQMESILHNWAQIKIKLRGVKEQVELAMEWEELWSNVLGDVGMEIDNLSGMIFEMEEKRHQSLLDNGESTTGLDINELETIVEESPIKGRSPANRHLSLGPMLAAASGTPVIKTPQDDSSYSNLMALFARMQPLRASLDFLPMRLSMFQSRAEGVFPSACEEVDDRRSRLEKSYKVLEQDAEALRKELGEDKWIIVFRNAGSQAQKMFDSVERSIAKLQEGLETNAQVNNPANLTKRIENYEAKKIHYVPAIERVISIIQKGVNDRLTVNGEVLRLLSDMTSRTDALKASLRVMDSSLEDVQIFKGQQLRDSISSIITMDSPATGSAIDTPGSSPASSVIMSGSGYKPASTPLGGSSRRESSVSSVAARSSSKVRRFSGVPQPTTGMTGRKSSLPKPSGLTSPTHGKPSFAVTPTPAGRRMSRVPQPSPIPNRPRWNTSTNTNDLDVGHPYRPLGATTPNGYRRTSAPTRTTPRPASTVPFRRDMSGSPAPSSGRSVSRLSTRFASSSRSPVRNASSPTPERPSLLDPPPYSRLRRASPMMSSAATAGMNNAPRSRQSFAGMGTTFSRSVSHALDMDASPTKPTRPGTSLGHSGNSRRTSLLPLPKRTADQIAAQKKADNRPPWRA